jgi:hypothetical protein
MAPSDDFRDDKGRFVKGNPGSGTGGRPKGSVSITRVMREVLEESGEKEAKKLAKAILRNAAKGNSTAIKEVLDRIDGPVKQMQEGSVTVRVVFGEEDEPGHDPSA